MDKIDHNILRILQADASKPIAEIARLVNLSQTPCWNRIRKMEAEGIIKGRVALVDSRKVGLGLTAFVAVEAINHTREWAANFRRLVQSMPEVMDSYRMAGDIDYLLRVVVPDMQAYDDFYNRLIEGASPKNVTSRFSMEVLSSRTVLPF
ncbi:MULTISPECIES: Lrp/AsnC family transcriptional regulator [Ancylobacter]|uniref:Transcriptional regulator n=1 Tax=Ancylobacter defluvii TaxID=1282440 RepID=A0A9W6JXV1_9HYPH|nr:MULTISPECIES: Lrp/AsnC family transcriptional regulator [Ancylobacter]MBS7588619.1 Lrp/AsnC family transcriptional regulator [Ancylobacter defluvii]MDR6951325.1 Lrp/AsnC family transcriptional regulator [Ancylobacter sp. 3268]GLK83899.1 transcriptional regulator [Ancylobacter defluvii]